MPGTVQRLRLDRGFGFLRPPGGAGVFFHRSVVTPPDRFVSSVAGMLVEFEAEAGPKGPRATKVTLRLETR